MMTKTKFSLFALLICGVMFAGCKKEVLYPDGSPENTFRVNEQADISGIPPDGEMGDCAKRFADSTRKWVKTYGYGGLKEDQNYEAATKMFEIGYQMTQCKGPQDENTPGPYVPAEYFEPPVFEEFRASSIGSLLALLNATNLCNEANVANARAAVAPLNVIINRAINQQISPNDYYNATSSERLYFILSAFYANEDYLLDDIFTFKYLVTMAELSFPIPHIAAQKIFDLDPSFQGTPDANGAYATLQRWQGHLIDISQSTLTSANCILPTPVTLPLPLPSMIFYLANASQLGQFIPHLSTDIFYNSSDNKYYVNSSLLNFVPNGYYDSPTEVVMNNHKYYHIVDGVITEILNVNVDPNGPVGP